jgi:hypothetical protein
MEFPRVIVEKIKFRKSKSFALNLSGKHLIALTPVPLVVGLELIEPLRHRCK